MPYAHRPLILDADTHMMEHADWLPAFADPDIRPRLVPFAGKDARVRALAADAVARAEARRGDATLRAEAEAEFMSMKFKGWHGLGAFDAAERRRANDLMGFGAYLVFPTEAFNQVIAASDPEVLAGGIRALNRGLADFCAEDRRMGGVGYLRLADGPDSALAQVETISSLGLPYPDAAVVIRYEGPRGGPGMRETHRISEVVAHMNALGSDFILITDGRYSGASNGFIIGYLAPEAAEPGAPLALIENGDESIVHASQNRLDLNVPADILAERAARFRPPVVDALPDFPYLARYRRLVGPVDRGAII
ncbi:MAG: dihydroxy-acid dehydratase [Phenylobacterium sp.]|nr:dihydroxy-acid dehydratase [Phenylobacterium sp.]